LLDASSTSFPRLRQENVGFIVSRITPNDLDRETITSYSRRNDRPGLVPAVILILCLPLLIRYPITKETRAQMQAALERIADE
jgi:hypothetical protein